MWKRGTSDRRSAGVDKSFVWLLSRLDSIAACLFVNTIYGIDEENNCSPTPDDKIPINNYSDMMNLFSLTEHVM